MTPAAITPAGRSTTKRGKPTAARMAAPRATTARTAAPRATAARTAAPPKPVRIVNPASAPSVPGHRRRLRPQSAPKVPRRVSGPARGRAAAITLPNPGQGGGVALPRPGRGGLIKPRSRPARRATRPRSQALPLPRRLLGAIWALPDHPLLDRVVRGRAWIAVLGVMLAGIVAMQIEVLKLGASIGRSLQRGTSLQSRNQQLQASVAALDDGARIQRLAGAMGMVMPAPNGVGFVSTGSSLVQKAIANIHQPNTASFLALTDPNGAITGVSTAAGASASGLSSASSTSTTVPATGTTGTTGATGTTSAGTPTTGTTSSTGISSQSTQAAGGATSTPATTQAATPVTAAPQATSPASAATGAVGTAPPASTQSTGDTGGAGVPAAG